MEHLFSKERIQNIMKYKKPTIWVSVSVLCFICVIAVILGSNRTENHSASLEVQEVVENMADDKNQEESVIDHTDIKAEFSQTELTHIPVATNARIENKTHLEQYDCVKVVVNQQNLDVTHDGIDDYIETVFYVPQLDAELINSKQVDPNQLFDGGNGCYVAIYDGNDTTEWNELGTLLWEKSYYGSHAGNGQINIVAYEGKSYLFATNLYAGQGDYDLSYEVFALESNGTYYVLAEDNLQISTREPNHSTEDANLLLEEEKQEILLFKEHMQQWIDAAKVLVITDVAMVEQLVSTLEKEYMSYPYYASIFQYYINDMIGTISGEEIVPE